MTPETLFTYSGPIAMAGWIALVLSPLAPRAAQLFAGILIPAILSVGYTALVLINWAGAPGGFDSLANVMLLFDTPEIALAGWVHYLAFDLFVGAWIVRIAQRESISHLIVVPVLIPTFLFGPAGFAIFLAIRAAKSALPAKQLEV